MWRFIGLLLCIVDIRVAFIETAIQVVHACEYFTLDIIHISDFNIMGGFVIATQTFCEDIIDETQKRIRDSFFVF
jgi:hypothetical protein